MTRMKFVVPDLLTAVNVCIGFVCLVLVMQSPPVAGIFHHNYIVSAWLILLAAVIDVLDGAVARMVGKTGPFGMEFDSLADLMVFAVAPCVLLYGFYYQGRPLSFTIVPLLYLVASAYRLARFNTNALQTPGKQFIGLPTTVSGAMVVGVILLLADLHRIGAISARSTNVMAAGTGFTLINAILMVSTIEFDTLDAYFTRRNKRIILPIVILVGFVLYLRLRSPVAGLLILGICYVAETLIRWLLGQRSCQADAKH